MKENGITIKLDRRTSLTIRETYVCNGYEVKAICPRPTSEDRRIYLLLNVEDLCKAMMWNDKVKDFLLSQGKDGYIDFADMQVYLDNFQKELIEYYNWLDKEILHIEILEKKDKDEMEVDVPTTPIIIKLIVVIMAIAGVITLFAYILRQIL